MKKLIQTLTQSPYASPMGFLLFLLIFAAVHFIALIFDKFSILTIYYPILFAVLLVKMIIDRK